MLISRQCRQSYSFVDKGECLSSFAMSSFVTSNAPGSFLHQPGYSNARFVETSSIYFVNLVDIYFPSLPLKRNNRKLTIRHLYPKQLFNLMALRSRHLSIFQLPPCFKHPVAVPGYAVLALHGHLLALCPAAAATRIPPSISSLLLHLESDCPRWIRVGGGWLGVGSQGVLGSWDQLSGRSMQGVGAR